MKRPMRTYRPDETPMTCADCGGRLRYDRDRFAWVHEVKGADHAPHIAGMVRHGR